jgi:hypothetical protein
MDLTEWRGEANCEDAKRWAAPALQHDPVVLQQIPGVAPSRPNPAQAYATLAIQILLRIDAKCAQLGDGIAIFILLDAAASRDQ